MQHWWRNRDFILILSGFCGLRGGKGATWTQSLVRLGTRKIYGSAEGVALTLCSRKTALPATVSGVFMIV